MTRAFLVIFFALLGSAVAEDKPSAIPQNYKQVWADEFTALSLRSGGPTDVGLEAGSGTWAAANAWYSRDPRGFAGYGGYDWFTNPSYYGWPVGYHGELTITDGGLRVRSEPPLDKMTAILPTVNGNGWAGPKTVHAGVAPWLSGQINSFHAVRIRPPFYFEARAKMPVGSGRPFSAIWMTTQARHSNDDHGMNYEIDVQEGFGDSDRLHAGIHWDASATHAYPERRAADLPTVDLSAGFNTWGCDVTKERQIFYFNGVEIGRVETPFNADIDQPFGIIFDVSAGMPWKGGGPPSGGPHDMIVRYVRLYAPNANGLTLQKP